MKMNKILSKLLVCASVVCIFGSTLSVSAATTNKTYVDQDLTTFGASYAGTYCTVSTTPFASTVTKSNSYKKGVTYHDYTADGDGNYVLRARNNSTGTYTAVSTSVSKNTKIMKRRSQGWIYNSDGSQITQCIVLTVYK